MDELRTGRLLLRGWRPEDRVPFAAMNADPLVTRYLGHPPLSAGQSDDLVDRIGEHWDRWGYGLWAVEDRADGAFLGFVGLSHHRWYPDDVEIGWRLRPDRWGTGLATEGARAALDRGFGELGLERIVSVIHRDNVASRRVAEKCGLNLWREETRPSPFDGEPLPIVVYDIARGG